MRPSPTPTPNPARILLWPFPPPSPNPPRLGAGRSIVRGGGYGGRSDTTALAGCVVPRTNTHTRDLFAPSQLARNNRSMIAQRCAMRAWAWACPRHTEGGEGPYSFMFSLTWVCRWRLLVWRMRRPSSTRLTYPHHTIPTHIRTSHR